jgi:uncharacterized damage-inducible protein DinB
MPETMKRTKQFLRWLGCSVAVVLSAGLMLLASTPRPVPQAAAQGTVLAELTRDWSAQQSTLRQLANAMADDKFGYKPTANERSYGEQVMHVALINVEILKTIGGKSPAPTFTEESAKTKADMVKALSDSYDYGLALLKEQTETSMIEKVRAPTFVGTGAGAMFLGPSTRTRIFWFLMNHAMDIYGQMVVYARTNGVVPPASGGNFQ